MLPEIVQRAIDRNVILGEGKYSSVLETEDPSLVIKVEEVADYDDPWWLFAKHCVDATLRPSIRRHFPGIVEVGVLPIEYWAARPRRWALMKRLKATVHKARHNEDLVALYTAVCYTATGHYDEAEWHEYWGDLAVGALKRPGAHTAFEAAKVLKAWRDHEVNVNDREWMNWDLHQQNGMIDDDGVLVFVDPWSGSAASPHPSPAPFLDTYQSTANHQGITSWRPL